VHPLLPLRVLTTATADIPANQKTLTASAALNTGATRSSTTLCALIEAAADKQRRQAAAYATSRALRARNAHD